MGATVLHEDSIFPLRKEGNPIHVLNTNAPEDPGTMIVENTCSKPHFTITGIAGKKGFAAVTIEKSMMNTEIGFGRKVLQVFEENGISFEHTPSGIDTMTVFVHRKSSKRKNRALSPVCIALCSRIPSIWNRISPWWQSLDAACAAPWNCRPYFLPCACPCSTSR